MKTIKKTLLLFALLFIFCVVSNSQEIEKEKTFNQPFETVSDRIIQNLSKYYGKSFKTRRALNKNGKRHTYFSTNWETAYDKDNKNNEQKERFKINIYETDQEKTSVKLNYQVEYRIEIDNKKQTFNIDGNTLDKYYDDFFELLSNENINTIQKFQYKNFDFKEYLKKKELDYKGIRERTYNIEYSKVYSKMLANIAKTFKSIQFADRESGVILTDFVYPGDTIQQFFVKRRFKINLLLSKISETETSVSAEVLTQVESNYGYQDLEIKKDKNIYDTLFKILEDGLL